MLALILFHINSFKTRFLKQIETEETKKEILYHTLPQILLPILKKNIAARSPVIIFYL